MNWEVVFLLAGVIPLDLAMEQTGAARLLAAHVTALSATLPAIATLGLFYS